MNCDERVIADTNGYPLTWDNLVNILDHCDEAVIVYDGSFHFLYANARAERETGHTAEALIGKVLWDLFPETMTSYYEIFTRAIQEQIALPFEIKYAPDLVRMEGRCVPITIGHDLPGLAVFFRNVTHQRHADAVLAATYERERLLNRINMAIRDAVTPEEIQASVAQMLGAALQADRCYFNHFYPSQDAIRIGADWHRSDLPSIAGDYPLSLVQPLLLDELFSNGATLTLNDVRESFLPTPTAELMEQIGYRSLITAPFYRQNELTAILAVVMTGTGRDWTPDEVALVEAVVAQTRSAVEAAQLFVELQARVRREEMINRIGARVRSLVDPETIKAEAAAMLGEALAADRCYFASYDLNSGLITIAADWHRIDLPSIQGAHSFVNTAEMFRELYPDSHISTIVDAHAASLSPQTRANMERLQLRSRVAVALTDKTIVRTTFTVAMTDAPRLWTHDDIELIEGVAMQMRAVLELAAIQQREHRIATELQDALQPTVPKRLHHLQIDQYTKPALDEAAIGGDFYDVFDLDAQRYAFVIGDVSGKGLSAAAQIATVRNMLRASLYQSSEPADAIINLNRVLTKHNLLPGFVTVMTAIYHTGTGQLDYVCCGHEPGMILRACDNSVDLLKTTGAPLGVDEHAAYRSSSAHLSVGDTLLLYTDGLSEAGPNRRQMIGSEGLIGILQGLLGSREISGSAAKIVAKVGESAGGIFRDDVCVLVARRDE